MKQNEAQLLLEREYCPAPTDEQVRAQVQRLLDSVHFSGSPQLSRFLTYIVEETLKGNGKRLKQYTIATEALNRDSGFDPNTDPSVRLDAGRLRRALANYYANAGPDEVFIDVPKGGYVPVFRVFAARPGNETDRLPDAGPHGTASSNAALDYSEPLLIMRLDSHAEDERGNRFAAELTEQIIVEFGRYSNISILSSQFSLGEMLPNQKQDVRFVLCGGVTKADQQIRITVRLHDFAVNSIIWTEKFDVDAATNLFESQDEVARRIAGIIADDFGIVPYRLGLEMAYRMEGEWSLQDTILSHRFLARTMTEKAFLAAREKVEIGIRQVPYHSMLWAIRAHTTFYGNVLGYEHSPDWLTLVQRYAGYSLELDHQNHYALVVMAQLHLFQRNFDEVLHLCQRLLEKNPHAASNRLSAGYFSALAGEWESGTQMLGEALGMLQHPPGWAYKTLFLHHFRARRYAQALREINFYNVPNHFTPPLLRAAVLVKLERWAEAEAAANEVRRINPRLKEISDTYLCYLCPADELIEEIVQPLRKLGLL